VGLFRAALRASFMIVSELPSVTGIVRNPYDYMILTCAVAATADYVVTRDDALASLGIYEDIAMVTPEAFLRLLRNIA
jgi:predicted nucleic acid-binding protein